MRIIIFTLIATFLVSTAYSGDKDLEASIGFVENRGQLSEPEVRFYLKRDNFTIYFKDDEIVYQLTNKVNGELQIENIALGLNAKASGIHASKPHGAKLNYYYGTKGTTTESFGSIVYKDIYEGIDLHYYLSGDKLKYDFIVHPGADYNQIAITYSQLRDVNLDNTGCLVVTTPLGNIEENEPITYQGSLDNVINSAYKLDPAKKVMQFEVDDFDASQPLIIDPEIDWVRLFGGAGSDEGLASIVAGDDGSVYLGGATLSDDLPATDGKFQEELDEQQDGYIAKFDLEGNLIWATYYGSDGDDRIFDLDIDSNGNIYAVGYTTGRPEEFPLLPAGQDVSGNGGDDAFIVKFSPDGTLLFAKLYGGTSAEAAYDIDVFNDDNIYIAGITASNDFPTTAGAYQEAIIVDSGSDAFLTKIDGNGNVQWSTYYGGDRGDEAIGLGVDIAGNPVIVGSTASEDLPEIDELPLTEALSGAETGRDGFIAKFDVTGSTLLFASYVGGPEDDYIRDVKVTPDGDMVYAGYTASSTNFLPQPDNAYGGGVSDAFIGSVSALGASNWIHYLGGSEQDRAWAVLIDAFGNIIVNGGTESFDFPVEGFEPFIIQKFKDQEQDAFFATYEASGDKTYATYIGGDQEDFTYDMALDITRTRLLLAGTTRSDNLDPNNEAQSSDAFIMAIDLRDSFCPQFVGNGVSAIGPEICLSEGDQLDITGSTVEIFPDDLGLTFSYQYQVSINGAAYSDIPGATDQNLPGFTLTQTGTYRIRRVVISDDFPTCTFASDPEEFSVLNDDIEGNTITSAQAGDPPSEVCQPTIEITGSDAVSDSGLEVTYQYQISTDGTSFTAINGATDRDLLSLPASLSGLIYIRRQATVAGSRCSDYSDVLQFSIFDDEITSNIISSEDEDKAVCVLGDGTYNIVGEPAVSSNGAATITYQYEYSEDGGVYQNIGGNVEDLGNFNPTAESATGLIFIRRRVISGLGGACSGENISNVLIFNTTPSNITDNTIAYAQDSGGNDVTEYCQDAAISVIGDPATSTGTINYQYQIAFTSGEFFNISGATDQDLQYALDTLTSNTTVEIRRIATVDGGSCADASNILSFDILFDNVEDNVISFAGLTGNTTITECQGLAPFTIDGEAATGTGVTYQYEVSTDGGATFTTLGDSEDIEFTPGAAGNYLVRRIASVGDCDDISNTLEFEITEDIISENTITFSGDTDVCKGLNEELAITGSTPTATSGNLSYQYQISVDGGDFENIEGATDIDVILQGNQLPAGTIALRRWVVSDANNCPDISNTITFNVEDDLVEDNRIFSEDIGIFCPEALPIRIASAPTKSVDGDISYQYEVSTDGITWTTLADATDRDIDFTPDLSDGSDSYFIRRIASSSAADASCFDISNVLEFNPLRADLTISAEGIGACQNEIFTLPIDINDADEFYVILNAGTVDADTLAQEVNPLDGIYNFEYSFAEVGTYPISIAAKAECFFVSDPIVVTVSAPEALTFDMDDTACETQEVTLSVLNENNLTDFSLFVNDELVAEENDFAYVFDESGNYTLRAVANQLGCEREGDFSFTVLPTPVVNAGQDIPDVFLGQSVELVGVVTSSSNYSVLWTSDVSSTIETPNSLTTKAYPQDVTVFTLAATSEDGCVGEDNITVSISDLESLIPTAFTPNNDGVNDSFEIGIGVDLIGKTISYKIYNKWGTLIYETNNAVLNPWDGTYDGEEMPESVYYYTIDLDNGQGELEGTITLIR